MKMVFRLSFGGRSNHVLVRDFGRKAAAKKQCLLIETSSPYFYSGDGFTARVDARVVIDNKELSKIRKEISGIICNGFCGNDWMVDSIIQKGQILR